MIIKRLKGEAGTLLLKISLPREPGLIGFYSALTEGIIKGAEAALAPLTAGGGVSTLAITSSVTLGSVVTVTRTHTLTRERRVVFYESYTDFFSPDDYTPIPPPKPHRKKSPPILTRV